MKTCQLALAMDVRYSLFAIGVMVMRLTLTVVEAKLSRKPNRSRKSTRARSEKVAKIKPEVLKE